MWQIESYNDTANNERRVQYRRLVNDEKDTELVVTIINNMVVAISLAWDDSEGNRVAHVYGFKKCKPAFFQMPMMGGLGWPLNKPPMDSAYLSLFEELYENPMMTDELKACAALFMAPGMEYDWRQRETPRKPCKPRKLKEPRREPLDVWLFGGEERYLESRYRALTIKPGNDGLTARWVEYLQMLGAKHGLSFVFTDSERLSEFGVTKQASLGFGLGELVLTVSDGWSYHIVGVSIKDDFEKVKAALLKAAEVEGARPYGHCCQEVGREMLKNEKNPRNISSFHIDSSEAFSKMLAILQKELAFKK